MKKPILIALLGAMCLVGTAQNEIDALRYSLTNYEGTARFMGLGGAFGSLGGDVAAIGINPASMGRFSKNEFSFSMGTAFSDVSTDFYSNTSESSRSNFNIPNIGFVGTHNFKKRDQIGWQSVQFGISYNRLNNFHENIQIDGQTPNSYSLVFADWAEGNHEDDLINTNHYDSYLAYETWLIDPNPAGSGNYLTTIKGNSGVNASKNIARRGHMGSTEMALSGNYMNKLYVGGSIGIPTIRFSETSNHYESVVDDTINELDNFTFRETLTTRGSGFNFKAGIVVLPVEWIRLGASIQTPTSYRMSDRWQNSMETNFDNGDSYEASSDPGSYVYKLKTPLKITGSASIVLFERAVISADYELTDYSKARLGDTPYTSVPYEFTNENSTIGNIYQKASSIRLGAEVKVANPLLVRAGVQYRTSAMAEITEPQMVYSAGLGYRINKFYFDAAYVISSAKENFYLYDPVLVQEASVNKNISKAVVTIGFRY